MSCFAMEDYKTTLASANNPQGIEDAIGVWSENQENTQKLVETATQNAEHAAEFFTPLRLCRNLCTNATFQDFFLESKLYGSIITLVKTYVDESRNEGLWKTQRAALQVFANLSMNNTQAQHAVWGDFFPEMLRKFIHHPDLKILTATTAIIYNCILPHKEYLDAFLGEQMIYHLLERQVGIDDQKSFHWLLLILKLSFKEGYLESLMSNSPGLPNVLTCTRLGILQMYESFTKESDLDEINGLEESLEFLAGYLDVINQAVVIKSKTKRTTYDCPEWWLELKEDVQNFIIDMIREENSFHEDLSLRIAEAFFLQPEDCLEFLRWWFYGNGRSEFLGLNSTTNVTGGGTEEGKDSLGLDLEACNCILLSFVYITSKCSKRQDILTFLGQTRLIPFTIQFLRLVYEKENPQGATVLNEADGLYQGRSDCILEDDSASPFSLKRTLVKVLANICYKNKQNQDLIREQGGIELVLNSCRVDENNPFLMQWGLFGVRNLTNCNVENQEYIQNIAPQPKDQPERSDVLRRFGIEDEGDGRYKVSNMSDMM